jgi:hypothetical protein
MQAITFSDGRLSKAVSRLLLLVPLCLAGGCNKLSFDRETMVAAFPPGKDEIRFLLIYEGFHVTQDKKDNLEDAKKELDSLMTTEQEFRYGLPFLAFGLPHKDGESPEQRQVIETFRKHTTIRKGAFFQAGDNELNGFQAVTIRDAQKFVDRLNEHISASFARDLPAELAKPRKSGDEFDREWGELVLKAARSQHQWLKIKPGRISFTLPGTQVLFERGKREGLKLFLQWNSQQSIAKFPQNAEKAYLAGRSDAKEEFERNAAWLSELPLSIDQRKDRMTLSVGVGDAEPIIVRMLKERRTQNTLDKELVATARTLKVPFRERLTVDTLIAEFVKGTEKQK